MSLTGFRRIKTFYVLGIARGSHENKKKSAFCQPLKCACLSMTSMFINKKHRYCFEARYLAMWTKFLIMFHLFLAVKKLFFRGCQINTAKSTTLCTDQIIGLTS